MNRTKEYSRKKKKRLLLILGPLLILAVSSVLILIRWKPDWIYLARRTAASFFIHAEPETFTPDPDELQTFPAADLLQGAAGFIPGTELMLVNGSCPLPDDYVPELTVFPGTDLSLSPLLEEPYRQLSEDVMEETGDSLYIRSSFRSREEQEKEKEEQPAVAAAAGSSEHETGMALDVYIPYYAGYGFLKSEAGQYVNSCCWKYGFIIRYPFLKTDSTGIPFEPWHLRYTGLPHSEIISKNSWTLEEYLEYLKPGKFYRYGNYWISRQKNDPLTVPVSGTDRHISPDNQGGYVLWGRED